MTHTANLKLAVVDIETLGLDPFDYRVLHHLCFQAAPPNEEGERLFAGRTEAQIAQQCLLTAGEVADALRSLEDAGYIERREGTVLISPILDDLFVEGGLK